MKGAQSAIDSGYSEATAKQIAYNLLQEPEVEEYLDSLRKEASEKHNITKERWLNELELSGFSNAQDFIEEGNSVKDLSAIDRQTASAINSVKKTVIEGDFGVKTTTEFKLNDKLSALEKIGRHFGWYEKDNSQRNQETPIEVTIVSPKDVD